MTVETIAPSQSLEELYSYLGELKSRGGENVDYVRAVLENHQFSNLCHIYELIGIANKLPRPRDSHVNRALAGLTESLATCPSEEAQELSCLLRETYTESFLEVISKILLREYDTVTPGHFGDPDDGGTEKVRIIGLHKTKGETLGITLKKTKDGIMIARILHGGLIGRQGLLTVGDVIQKVNEVPVSDDPTQVQEWLTNTAGSLMLTILPSFNPTISDVKQLFVRAFFDYDPFKDDMCPSKEFGLSFKFGEILQIVNKDDDNWWQAVKVQSDGESEKPKQAGLIPSLVLQERRRAFINQDMIKKSEDNEEEKDNVLRPEER